MMLRPLILGMSPSRSYRDMPWHDEAESTKFLAKVILGDEVKVGELKKLFEMRNLNKVTPPKGAKYASYDRHEAISVLEELESDYALTDRLVVLLGDKVVKSFDAFAETQMARNGNMIVPVNHAEKYIDCKVLYIRHPSYFISAAGTHNSALLAKLAQDLEEINEPLKQAHSAAQTALASAEDERQAEATAAHQEALFSVWLANEDSDRIEREESVDDRREDEEDNLAAGFDRYERLLEEGWEEE